MNLGSSGNGTHKFTSHDDTMVSIVGAIAQPSEVLLAKLYIPGGALFLSLGAWLVRLGTTNRRLRKD